MDQEKGMPKEDLRITMALPLRYRWSGEFVGKDAHWRHMERQLVDYELIVMEKGILYIEDEWKRYEIGEGEYLIMTPTKLQRGFRPSKCRFHWMHFFLGTEGAQTGRETVERIELPRQGRLTNPSRLFVMMRQLRDSDLQYMDALFNGYFATAVLLEIMNQLRGRATGDMELQRRVDEYLLAHMHVPVSVGELAKVIGYHEKYFCMLFKKQTGMSVKKYVDERKMERAKYLLLNTDAYVSEIAENLGYEDVQNFYHVFKGMTNCTPSEFRKLYGKSGMF